MIPRITITKAVGTDPQIFRRKSALIMNLHNNCVKVNFTDHPRFNFFLFFLFSEILVWAYPLKRCGDKLFLNITESKFLWIHACWMNIHYNLNFGIKMKNWLSPKFLVIWYDTHGVLHKYTMRWNFFPMWMKCVPKEILKTKSLSLRSFVWKGKCYCNNASLEPWAAKHFALFFIYAATFNSLQRLCPSGIVWNGEVNRLARDGARTPPTGSKPFCTWKCS